jgi:hypothetical protein
MSMSRSPAACTSCCLLPGLPVRESHETVQLGVLLDDEVAILGRLHGRLSTAHTARIGYRFPATAPPSARRYLLITRTRSTPSSLAASPPGPPTPFWRRVPSGFAPPASPPVVQRLFRNAAVWRLRCAMRSGDPSQPCRSVESWAKSTNAGTRTCSAASPPTPSAPLGRRSGGAGRTRRVTHTAEATRRVAAGTRMLGPRSAEPTPSDMIVVQRRRIPDVGGPRLVPDRRGADEARTRRSGRSLTDRHCGAARSSITRRARSCR